MLHQVSGGGGCTDGWLRGMAVVGVRDSAACSRPCLGGMVASAATWHFRVVHWAHGYAPQWRSTPTPWGAAPGVGGHAHILQAWYDCHLQALGMSCIGACLLPPGSAWVFANFDGQTLRPTCASTRDSKNLVNRGPGATPPHSTAIPSQAMAGTGSSPGGLGSLLTQVTQHGDVTFSEQPGRAICQTARDLEKNQGGQAGGGPRSAAGCG